MSSWPAIGCGADPACGYWTGLLEVAGNTGDCGSIVLIQSGNAPGCTRLAADMLSCPADCDPSDCPCIHDGRDCSSINEFAAIPRVGKTTLSVFGAGAEAGLRIGCASDGVLSPFSSRPGCIQLGNVPSSMRLAAEKFDVPVLPPERSVSNHAGNSGCSAD